MALGFDADLANKSPDDAAGEVSDATDLLISAVDVDAFIQQSGTLEVDYNALKEGSNHLKDNLGSPKRPVAARISVLDLATQNYVATSTSFILLSVQRVRREKVQLTHGFDEQWLITTFGRDIPIYTISGVLMNFMDEKDWVSKMNDYYEKYLRASKLSERGRQAVVHYADRWMRGYFLGLSETMDSNNNNSIPFNASVAVRRDRTIGARTGTV